MRNLMESKVESEPLEEWARVVKFMHLGEVGKKCSTSPSAQNMTMLFMLNKMNEWLQLKLSCKEQAKSPYEHSRLSGCGLMKCGCGQQNVVSPRASPFLALVSILVTFKG